MEHANTSNNRILKNTLFMYLRMLLVTVITLYTSRVILKTLGVEDFGIYNIVGGIVVLFSFLSSALTQATQRFLTLDLGKQDLFKFNKTFNLSLLLYLFLSLLIVALAETIGLWFLNEKLNIDASRMNAANWVYQLSILSFVFNFIRIPYNAVIIAHEKLAFFAYLGLIEAIMKLAIVYILIFLPFDKLIIYSALVALVGFFLFIIHERYVNLKFNECYYCYYWNKKTFKEMISFSSWTLFGSTAVMTANQGVNIIINLFFGVTVNAAVGIANQVSSAVQQFLSNFQLAFNPQIIKCYASGDQKCLSNLIIRTSKFSFLLIFVISMPILIATEQILKLWLGTVPDYTVSFCQLIIISMIIDSLSGPLWMIIQAEGNIKKYQIVISSVKSIEIFFVYFLFLCDYSPAYAFVVKCAITFFSFFIRIKYSIRYLGCSKKIFFKRVLLRCLIVAFLCLFIFYWILNMNFYWIISCFIIALFCLFISLFIGLEKSEFKYLKEIVINIIFKNKNNINIR